jgi:hypothetical protein
MSPAMLNRFPDADQGVSGEERVFPRHIQPVQESLWLQRQPLLVLSDGGAHECVWLSMQS